MAKIKPDQVKIEYKTFPMEVKTVEAEGEERVIEGMANVYGILDSWGDIVEPGAFKKSLADDDVRPLLWHHRDTELIGDAVFVELPKGLRLTNGKLYEGVQRADETYSIVKQARRPMGLSIGFSIMDGGCYTDDEDVRHITEAKLYEVSLVVFPANAPSVIDAVKAGDVERLVEEYRNLPAPVASVIFEALTATLVESAIDGRKLSDANLDTLETAYMAIDEILCANIKEVEGPTLDMSVALEMVEEVRARALAR